MPIKYSYLTGTQFWYQLNSFLWTRYWYGVCYHAFMYILVKHLFISNASLGWRESWPWMTWCQFWTFLLFLGTNWKNQLQKKTQNTANPGKPAWPKWKSKYNAHMWPIHPSDNKVTPGHNKVLDTPSLIKFVHDDLVGHIRGFLQVLESPFPLDPAIILHSAPNDLSCFLNKPLHIVKNQIIPLMSDNPRKTALKKKTRCDWTV